MWRVNLCMTLESQSNLKIWESREFRIQLFSVVWRNHISRCWRSHRARSEKHIPTPCNCFNSHPIDYIISQRIINNFKINVMTDDCKRTQPIFLTFQALCCFVINFECGVGCCVRCGWLFSNWCCQTIPKAFKMAFDRNFSHFWRAFLTIIATLLTHASKLTSRIKSMPHVDVALSFNETRSAFFVQVFESG